MKNDEKYYDIERAAGALAKFPGHKSDLERTFQKFLIEKWAKLRVTEKIREPRPNI